MKRQATLWQLCVWTYLRQRAHWHLRTEMDRFLWQWAIEGGDPDGPRPVVHHDAGLLHEVVRTLPAWAAERVVVAAATGERPLPPDTEPKSYPQAHDRFARGMEGDRYSWADIEGSRTEYLIRAAEWVTETVPVYERRGRKRLVQIGTESKSMPVEFCPLVWEPDPVMFALGHDIAGHWWAAMKALERAIVGITFREFTLVPDEQLAEPPRMLEEPEIENSRNFALAQAAAVTAEYRTPGRGERAELLRIVDEKTGTERQAVRIRHARAHLRVNPS